MFFGESSGVESLHRVFFREVESGVTRVSRCDSGDNAIIPSGKRGLFPLGNAFSIRCPQAPSRVMLVTQAWAVASVDDCSTHGVMGAGAGDAKFFREKESVLDMESGCMLGFKP